MENKNLICFFRFNVTLIVLAVILAVTGVPITPYAYIICGLSITSLVVLIIQILKNKK